MSLPYDPYKAPASSVDGPVAGGSDTVPASVVTLLAQTRPWVRLFSILIFALLALMALGFLVMLAIGRAFLGKTEVISLVPALVIMAFYIPPGIFLWRYADGIRRLQDGGGMPALDEALTSQKSFWKYMGIFFVVLMCFYALLLVGGLIFGVLKARGVG